MSEEEIKELITDLGRAEYYRDGTTYRILYKEQLCIAENIIRQHLLNCHDKELGELKAKVYTYEKIIANSNFAPILEGDK